MRIVVADVGGTHARFALAELSDSARPQIGPMHRYRTSEHSDLRSAWAAFARDLGEELPARAAIAVAAPIEGEELRFMNSNWRLRRFGLGEELGLDQISLLNDFGAVANAVTVLGPDELAPIWGPNSLPKNNIISVIGPGTGLGVAILDTRGGDVRVIETEAAHIGYSPLDAQEQALAESLTLSYERASVERVVSGPGLIDIYRHLGGTGDYEANLAGELWSAAIEGTNPIAVEALDIFVRSFGAAAGDISLAHGAMGVVISGGLSNRIFDRLQGRGFSDRFVAKGRYRERMHRVSVMLATYPEPGLLGSAVAFQREHLGTA
jgi:glucokinase